MDFKQAVITCLRDKYVDFSGRAGKAEFWWFFLAQVIIMVIASFLGDILSSLVSLALLLPGLGVGTRRLHDIGKSGWLQLLWLIPVLGWALLIYWLVQPTGPANQYGEGPYQPAGSAVVPPPPGAA
jgi:uncharacterized membrane protein YhaH (DUF805 family)